MLCAFVIFISFHIDLIYLYFIKSCQYILLHQIHKIMIFKKVSDKHIQTHKNTPQALRNSWSLRPIASGFDRGSKSAKRLNQADMSLELPLGAKNTQRDESLQKQYNKRPSKIVCQLLTSYKTLTTGRWVWTILGRLSSTGRWLEGRVLKHRWSRPSWTTEREWIWTSQWLHWKLAAQQNCVVHSSSQQRANKRLCKPVALRLRSRSCDGRKPVGVFAVVPACGEGAVTGAGGASKQPKASCHALLNSLVPPAAPGLSRSCRKASSPLSPSSSFTRAESRASDNRSRPK